jgi:hypothetical protein
MRPQPRQEEQNWYVQWCSAAGFTNCFIHCGDGTRNELDCLTGETSFPNELQSPGYCGKDMGTVIMAFLRLSFQ